MAILYAGLVLGGIGLVFGLILTFASKAFHVDVDERVQQVRACCAGANCGACGYAGCDGFAEAVVKGEAPVNGCKPAGAEGAKKIAAIMGVDAGASEERQVARVRCQGIKGVAKERYTYDGYRSCAVAAGIAGGPCVEACPRSVIELLPVSQSVIVRCRNSNVARAARAVCMKACIGCGRCKKECQYDAIVVENGYARILPDKCVRCGSCAAVCPCNCITIE